MAEKKTSLRGTCAWCFGSYAATPGSITTKHGWQEISGATWTDGTPRLVAGGRKVGEYGRVHHSGNCNGMHYPPYELSTAGTEARLKSEIARIASCDERLAWLANGPALIEIRNGFGEYDRKSGRYVYAPIGVRLNLGEVVEVVLNPLAEKSWDIKTVTFDYERTRAAAVKEVSEARAMFVMAEELCKKMITEWSLKELGKYEPRKATVHRAGHRGTYCGNRKSYGLVTSTKVEEVTCVRCLRRTAMFEAQKAEAKARGAGE